MKSIFVSSTFRDMHFERDVLNRTVGPKLNYRLARHNRSLRILDLRWGVDTSELSEEEATERVLQVCFDEIENCRPHILVLLGDRYGYVPKGSKHSVTHMEILRGALENAQPEQVFLYCRRADYTGMSEEQRSIYQEQDPAARQQLEELKHALRQRLPHRFREYSAHWSEAEGALVSEDFEALVTQDLEEGFLKDLDGCQYRSPLHRQLSENEETLRDHIQFAYRNEGFLGTTVARIREQTDPFGLIGPAGAGKSVFTSLLCSALREAGAPADILFCGDNAFSASVRNAAEAVLHGLTAAAGLDYDYEANAQLSYNDLLSRISRLRESATQKYYLCLDAVDKCDPGMVDFILWCRRFLADEVGIIFSSRPMEEIDQAENTMCLGELTYDREDLAQMARRMLKKQGKSLHPGLVDSVCEKVTTPLQLQLLLLRLLNLSSEDFKAIQALGGGMDAINTYLGEQIEQCPQESEGLVAQYLQTLIEQSKNVPFHVGLLCMLSFCEHGLHENELQELCRLAEQPWIQLDYLDFLANFSFFIRTRDNGRLDISHDVLRQTLRELMEPRRRRICGMIATYFLYRDDLDAVGVRTFFDAAILGEQRRKIAQFMVKYQPTMATFEPEALTRAQEIRKCILDAFLCGKGQFLFSCHQENEHLEDLLRFQAVLSFSLLSSNDYLPEDVLLMLGQAVMAIPLGLDRFPAELAEMEFSSCENFLHNRHNAHSQAIDEFLAQCQQLLEQKNPGKRNREATPFALLDQLQDPNTRWEDCAPILAKLSKFGRSMAQKKDSAPDAEKLLLQVLAFLDRVRLDLDPELRTAEFADIYTSLGVAYKTMGIWEKALDFDQKSLEQYRQLYQKHPSPGTFKKYRERVYNVANVVEAWAMEEKTNVKLWQQTCRLYADMYQLELQAIAQGISERDLLQCASSILSYGTALVNTGQTQEGMDKYQEGIQLITELTQRHHRPDLLIELCEHLGECIYQLVACEQYTTASALTDAMCGSVIRLLEADRTHIADRFDLIVSSLSNQINDAVSRRIQADDIDNCLVLSRMLLRFYLAALPLDLQGIKVNLMITQKNIADILFLRKKDYQCAAEEYLLLLSLLQQHDLAGPDKHGKTADQINVRMIDVYLRAVFCMEKLGQTEQVKQMVDNATAWSKYLCARTEACKGDPARVLFVMGADLSKRGSHLGLVFLMLAFNATQEEDYDQKANKDTVLLILKTLAGMQGGQSEQ